MADGQAVLRLSGDLDMDSAELFAEAARRVHAGGPSLVLDLSAVDFVDSSGLSQFVLSLKRQREIGGEVGAPGTHQLGQARLDIVGLSEMLPIAGGTPGDD